MNAEASSFLPKQNPVPRSWPRSLFLIALLSCLVVIKLWLIRQTFDAAAESLDGGEIGRNVSTESVRYILFSGNDKHHSLLITVESRRHECNTGQCIYRAYASGPTRHAGYLSTELTDSKGLEASYWIQFPIYEPGHYEILVLLESFINTTYTTVSNAEIAFDPAKGGHCSGERISIPHAYVQVDFEPSFLQTDPQMYRTALPKCRYSVDMISTNAFEWVDRRVLEKYKFSPEETLMIPKERLDPTRNLHHFERRRSGNPQWIQPYQDYVWHSRSCVQKWVPAVDIWNLATKLGKLHIVLIGTSRVLDTYTSLQSIVLNNASNSNIKITYVRNIIETSRASFMRQVLQQNLDLNHICDKGDRDTSSLAIMLSHGIWEANYHDKTGGMFNFDDNAQNSIEFIKKRCAGRNYRLLLMTNPLVQNFDSRKDASRVLQRYWYIPEPIIGTRIEKANLAWRKMAAKYNLSIIDAAGASFPRRDVNFDNVHYVLNDRRTHQRIQGRVGNEVSMTFAQLTMAGFLEAFSL